MSQIGILTPTQASDATPNKWVKKHEARRLVKRALITMISKDLARECVRGAANSDSQRFSKPAIEVTRVYKLPVREWRQSLDLNYPEIGRESNARLLRRQLWARAYPQTVVDPYP